MTRNHRQFKPGLMQAERRICPATLSPVTTAPGPVVEIQPAGNENARPPTDESSADSMPVMYMPMSFTFPWSIGSPGLASINPASGDSGMMDSKATQPAISGGARMGQSPVMNVPQSMPQNEMLQAPSYSRSSMPADKSAKMAAEPVEDETQNDAADQEINAKKLPEQADLNLRLVPQLDPPANPGDQNEQTSVPKNNHQESERTVNPFSQAWAEFHLHLEAVLDKIAFLQEQEILPRADRSTV